MRGNLWVRCGALILALLVGAAEAAGQPLPAEGKNAKGKAPPPPPDEEKVSLNQIKEAYKAQYEVHQDVLKELRKSFQQPSPEREAKIFKELRRLYVLTDERETAILREIRRAYDRPSPEQEERIFQEIERAERLAPGTVPAAAQARQVRKLFLQFDRNGDGVLSGEELPDSLRGDRAPWDANRDGFIDTDEYLAYHQGRLGWLSEQVASGQIDLGLKRGGPGGGTVPTTAEKPRPAVPRGPAATPVLGDEEKPRLAVPRAGQLPPGLPAWFVQLDGDRDAQIGLYEWRAGGRPLKDFASLDRNDDGFITVEEVQRYLARQSPNRSANLTRAGTPTGKNSATR